MADPVTWFEIHGPDPAALGAFYAELFGWSVEHIAEMDYRLVDTNGGAGIKGGISPNPEKSARTIFYVECADPGATLDRAVELGASVMMPVMEIPNGPTIAVFNDPVGNWIGLVKEPQKADPPPTAGDGRPLSWFEIHGGPFDDQAAFYTQLFGWEIEKTEGPGFTYGEIKNLETGCSGALSAPSSGFTGVTLWALVDDCRKYLERAESLGGKIDMEPMKVNENLTVANFIDPQGNRFGVFQPS